jgi:uncharacterized lipoprotein YddW (UPF0748 family)
MKILLHIRLLILFLPVLLFCSNNSNAQKEMSTERKQPKMSEFRAVWVATINNIDWPSRPNLSVDEQKSEFIKLLDSFQKFNMNVVILQVRAASDAFYPSATEPWSLFLTGRQGMPPKPFYDPLAWAIDQCHQRGMELHAWFNPFRVRNLGHYTLDPKSFASIHPQYVKEFDKKLFLDPGYPEVISHVVAVIAEVAHNYNVDAILLDDYFYPYPVEGKNFSDEKSFAQYGHNFYPGKLKEWRRENINHFISSIHDTLISINPKIKFGISPFGIWRNKSADPDGSAGRRGISSYDDLYADVRKWLVKGWIDYVIPQLYWEKGNHFGDFTALVQWWSENCFGKPLYIGQALYKSTAEKNGWNQPDELNEQINFLRTNEKVRGFAFYSASNLGKLSVQQAIALRDKQLQNSAMLDDDRHLTVVAAPTAAPPLPDSVKIARLEALWAKDFQMSLDFNPISIRPSLKPVGGVVPEIKRLEGKRILSWNMKNDTAEVWFALVTFKKTGKKRYLQNVMEISKSGNFIISNQKWQEIKNMELLLVCRDVLNKSDQYSDFFQLKRRRVKTLDNPFRHS